MRQVSGVGDGKASQSTVNGPNVYLCIKCRPFDHISYSAHSDYLCRTHYIHLYTKNSIEILFSANVASIRHITLGISGLR